LKAKDRSGCQCGQSSLKSQRERCSSYRECFLILSEFWGSGSVLEDVHIVPAPESRRCHRTTSGAMSSYCRCRIVGTKDCSLNRALKSTWSWFESKQDTASRITQPDEVIEESRACPKVARFSFAFAPFLLFSSEHGGLSNRPVRFFCLQYAVLFRSSRIRRWWTVVTSGRTRTRRKGSFAGSRRVDPWNT
jgi:hypothetical protein